MNAFVTGGSGFVGFQLIKDLVARGDRVRALARSDSAAQRIREAGGEPVRGDLDDDEALRKGVDGCELVFHAAAKVDVWGKRSDFERITVRGTRRILEASRSAGVARFVHVSTEAVLVGGPSLIDADETWPLPEHPIGLYPWSKGQAELAVKAAADGGLAAMIVRPRAIWGAGDTVFLPRLCKLVDAGKFAWVGGGHALTSTCHVKNVCAGLLAAAERGKPGEAYFVTDGPPVSYREFIGGQLQALGRDVAHARVLPLSAARVGARALEAYWTWANRPGEPLLTRTAVELIGSQVTVRDDKARRELGYRPVITREQGLEELARDTQLVAAA
ncbi:MAG: NAD-dependent epimerase/dehydratase family protein [Polyangiales bacterium]